MPLNVLRNLSLTMSTSAYRSFIHYSTQQHFIQVHMQFTEILCFWSGYYTTCDPQPLTSKWCTINRLRSKHKTLQTRNDQQAKEIFTDFSNRAW